MANEAAEIRKQLSSGRDAEKEALVQSTLEEVFDSVLEALLRSAAAGAELLEMREVCTESQRYRFGYKFLLLFGGWVEFYCFSVPDAVSRI